MSLIGPECFDFKFYKDKNPDLPPFPAPALWEHFVVNGQFEVCTHVVCPVALSTTAKPRCPCLAPLLCKHLRG